MLEPLSSWLSKEEYEALKARLLSLVSNDMDFDSCMKSCSTESLITPTRASFENTVDCLKSLNKISHMQFNDPILQMGIEECLNILKASNKFPIAILDGLEARIDSLLLYQQYLAFSLPTQESLTTKQTQI